MSLKINCCFFLIATVLGQNVASAQTDVNISALKLKIQQDIELLKQEVNYLKTKDIKHEKLINELKKEILELRGDRDLLTTQHNTTGGETKAANMAATVQDNSITTDTSSIVSPLLSRQRRAVADVAFSVYLSSSQQHLTNEPIKFDRILLNDGGHYNPYTGAFTAPVTGVYVFSFTFDTTASTFVRLVIDGVNQIDGVANRHVGAAGDRQSQNTGGNTCVLRVNHGQAVLVEVYEIADTTINSSNTFRLTSFSGFLLY